ncbi:MAG TPA: hypothetical protein PLC98_14865 [Anaerolineales bacterium]|nr:hypothetical protein [Anaerolineales bacterium]
MSKIRKARKLRTPNVPLSPDPIAPVDPVESGNSGLARTGETTSPLFDYTHVVGDLRRIGLLAGTFIVILIALTFVIR